MCFISHLYTALCIIIYAVHLIGVGRFLPREHAEVTVIFILFPLPPATPRARALASRLYLFDINSPRTVVAVPIPTNTARAQKFTSTNH